MASTNKTTNYNLSQYVGTDKPTYLGDYNSDMSKIDTQMKTNADSVGAVVSSVSNLETKVGNLTTLETTEKSNLVGAINEVKNEADETSTNVGSLESLTTENKSSVVNAINEVNDKIGNAKGQILWTNPNPSTGMSRDTQITLNNSNYDTLEVIYKVANDSEYVCTQKMLKGNSSVLISGFYGTKGRGIYYRELIHINDTTFRTGAGEYFASSGNGSDANNNIIPIYIIGYNTGIEL